MSPISRYFKIPFKLILSWAKFSPRIRELYSTVLYLISPLVMPLKRVAAADFLMVAHRNTRKVGLQLKVESYFRRFALLDRNIIRRLVPGSFRHQGFYHGRVFKIGEQSKGKKGVAIVKYSETFSKLFKDYDIPGMLNDYLLILEPSYSGYCNPEILQFMEYSEFPVIIQAAEEMDYNFIKRLGSNLMPINIGSSDWVDDRIFTDLSLAKEYDCIMVAMWNDIKRHHVLMKAIRRIADPSFKACLIGGPWGRVLGDLEEQAEFFGVKENIEFYERLKPEQVSVLLNKSKVNLLLTLKEGANKAIFEGFFANVPGIVLKNNFGVNKKYLNDFTGMLIEESKLADTLLWFRDGYKKFNPRKWALENISSRASTAKIESTLLEISKSTGQSFDLPLALKVNRPECEYYENGIKLSPFDLEKYRIK